MLKKLLMLKIAGALALLGATAGGVAANVINTPSYALKTKQAEFLPNETKPKSPDNPNPGTDLRNTDYQPEPFFNGVQGHTWDSRAIDKERIKQYAYKLTKKNRAEERSYYSYEAIKKQTLKMTNALSNISLAYSEEMAKAVYNFVQMIDSQNVDDTVAWESKSDLKEGQKDIGLIWLEGGPRANPAVERIESWNLDLSSLGAFYYLKEAQFGLYPLQIVGQHGASATNNFYMQKLQSKYSNKLQNYKKWYEAGMLGNSALLWAIAGDLDLDLAQLYGAMSFATIIVGTARTSALTKQLYESGFERVSLVGISYGMTLGLTILANNLKLLDRLYRISLGENALASAKLFRKNNNFSEENIKRENEEEKRGWNRGIFDINAAYDIKNMLKLLLRPEGQKISQQEKIAVHVARDDDHGWTHLYDDEEKYFEQTLGIANYQQYELGGHGIWGSRKDMQEWVLGLKPGEKRYV